MGTVIYDKIGDALRVRCGLIRNVVPPGRARVAALSPGSLQVQTIWSAAPTGGTAITGYTVRVYDGSNALVVSEDVGSSTTSLTQAVPTNGVPYTSTVQAHAGVLDGAESEHAGPVTPLAILALRPTVSNTGVAIGLPGDIRAPATLTPAASLTGTWFTRTVTAASDPTTGFPGYQRFTIRRLPTANEVRAGSEAGVIDSVDFTDWVISLAPESVGALDGLKMSHQYWYCPTLVVDLPSEAYPGGKPPVSLISVSLNGDAQKAHGIDGLTFEDVTYNGRTIDSMVAMNTAVTTIGCSNVVYRRVFAFGCSNGIGPTDITGLTIVDTKVGDRDNPALRLLTGKTRGWTRGLTSTVGTGGSLTAGEKYIQVSAVVNKYRTTGALLGTYQTVMQPLKTQHVTAVSGNKIDLTWTKYAVATGSGVGGSVVQGYRIYVGHTAGPTVPTDFDGFIYVSGADTLTLSYTGQSLTTTGEYPEYIDYYAHPDAMQPLGYLHDLLIQNSDLFGWSTSNIATCACYHAGAASGTGPYSNFRVINNWLDGGSVVFSGYTEPAWSGYIDLRDNLIGTDLAHGIRTTKVQSIMAQPQITDTFTGNRWMRDGTVPFLADPVIGGELVPVDL